MSVQYSPTQYSPAAVKTTAGTTALDNQTQGSLATIVVQPSPGMWPRTAKGQSPQLQEVFKGPASILKLLPGQAVSPYGRFYIGRSRDSLHIDNTHGFIVRFDAPPVPGDPRGMRKWRITSVDVSELTAGDHAIMTVTYGVGDKDDAKYPEPEYTEPEGEEEEAKEEFRKENGIIEDSWSWSMTFAELQVPIWAYVGNQHSGSASDSANIDEVRAWMNEPNFNIRKLFKYQNKATGELMDLSESSTYNVPLAKKIMQGVTHIVQYYPVLECSWSIVNKSFLLNKIVGADLNSVVGNPTTTDVECKNMTCPFTLPTLRSAPSGFLSGWLNVSDTITADVAVDSIKQTPSSSTIRRSKKWIGLEACDQDFYWEYGSSSSKNNVWQVGADNM